MYHLLWFTQSWCSAHTSHYFSLIILWKKRDYFPCKRVLQFCNADMALFAGQLTSYIKMTIAWPRGLKSCVGKSVPISDGWQPEGIPEDLTHRQQQAMHDFRRPLRCKWDLQCIMLCKYRRFGTTNMSHLQGPNILIVPLHPWRLGRLVVPKRQYVNTILRCAISQNSADLSSKVMVTMDRNDSAQVVLMTSEETVKTG